MPSATQPLQLKPACSCMAPAMCLSSARSLQQPLREVRNHVLLRAGVVEELHERGIEHDVQHHLDPGTAWACDDVMGT
eukprot:3368288-Alexandrium_andersonii.AAC.1